MGDSSIYDSIERSFEELGVVYNKDIVFKCVELCTNHGIDNAEELVDSWMAFSVSHLQGEDPTAQHLSKFERDILAKKKARADSSACETTLNITDAGLNEIANSYAATPQRLARTPDGSKTLNRFTDGPRACFSPASFSPSVGTPSSRYEGRRNAGSVICEREPISPEGSDIGRSIEVTDVTPWDWTDTKFMTFHLTDYADATETHINRITTQLSLKHTLEEFVPVRTKNPTPITTAGRVICDADGKLNSQSVLLESSPDSGGDTVMLDLSKVPSQAVFPGQVMAVCGLNVSGTKLVAQTVWTDASLTDPPDSVNLPGCLRIMIASGPFSTTDSLAYQPLADFLSEVVREEPHLLILTGPLIDSDHSSIRENLIAETFSDMFVRLVSQIMQPLKDLKTKVVFVSSYRESNGPAVFPTPPHRIQNSWHNLKFLPDPCVIDVEGIMIAITSTDVLMHLGKEESTSPGHHGGDRLLRLTSHILQQQSMYPLRPPPPEVPLDPTLEERLSLQFSPHILVLPSDLRCFIKDINNVTVVNPEHLAKGLVGGSFAKITVSPKGAVSGQVIRI